MWAGIAALVIAVLLIRARKFDKVVVVCILLGAGMIAKHWGNPATGWSQDFVQAVALVGLAALIIDFLTRKIERLTYALAFVLPFFALACNGAIGEAANALYGSGWLIQTFDTIA